jgi:hypothetical protein
MGNDYTHRVPDMESLIEGMSDHLQDCFPQMKLIQRTQTLGWATLVGPTEPFVGTLKGLNGIELYAGQSACIWTAICQCGWYRSTELSDETPTWEVLGGGDE